MHQNQHGSDAEIGSAHRCQNPRQFTVFGTLKHVQRHSYCQQAKACEYPGRSGLHSHRAATPHSGTKQDYPARIPASRWKRATFFDHQRRGGIIFVSALRGMRQWLPTFRAGSSLLWIILRIVTVRQHRCIGDFTAVSPFPFRSSTQRAVPVSDLRCNVEALFCPSSGSAAEAVKRSRESSLRSIVMLLRSVRRCST